MAYIFTRTPGPEQQLRAMVIYCFKIEGGRSNAAEFTNDRGALNKKAHDIVRDGV